MRDEGAALSPLMGLLAVQQSFAYWLSSLLLLKRIINILGRSGVLKPLLFCEFIESLTVIGFPH